MAAQSVKPQMPTPDPVRNQDGSVTLPDGTVMYTDPVTGAMTSEAMQAANAGPMAASVRPGAMSAMLIGASNGATFGWGDELAGAVQGPGAAAWKRAEVDASRRDYPVTTGVSEAAGNVLGAYVGARVMPQAVRAAAVASPIATLATSTAGGAVMGALQGAGEAKPGEKLQGAGTGAAIGGAFGLAGPVLLSGLQAGSRRIWNWVRKTDISGITRGLGISADAAKILKTQIDAGDYAAAMESLRKAGPDAMLADSSQMASNLLDTSIAAGGPSMEIARGAVETRAAAAAGRLSAAMDATLGPAPEGIKTAAKGIAQRTSAARKAAYDAAYASPIDYAGQAGQAIEGVIARMPPKTVSAAVQEANDAMREAGVQNMQIMATIGPDGAVTFSQPMNVQQLDFLKRSLGDIAEKTRDQFGRLTGEGQRAARLASDLKDALGTAVPDYRKAVKLGGDKIAEDKALQLGRDLLKPSTTRETVRETMAGASLEARQSAAQGIRTAFAEAMDNVRATAANPETDARAALKAVMEFSSKANREKAAIVLGADKAQKLFDAFDEAAKQLALRAAIAKGSQTAFRSAGKQAMDAIIEGNPLDLLKQGKPAEAARGITQILTASTPEARIKRTQDIYGEVARALVEKRGPDAMQALAILQRAVTGAPVTQAQADLVAKAVTGAAVLGGYESSMQGQRK